MPEVLYVLKVAHVPAAHALTSVLLSTPLAPSRNTEKQTLFFMEVGVNTYKPDGVLEGNDGE